MTNDQDSGRTERVEASVAIAPTRRPAGPIGQDATLQETIDHAPARTEDEDVLSSLATQGGSGSIGGTSDAEAPSRDDLDASNRPTIDSGGSRSEGPAPVVEWDRNDTMHDSAGRGGPARGRPLHEPGGSSRYSRTKVHGEGGLGVVWSAVDHDIGREVALKELRSSQPPGSRHWMRFLREARITGQLEHPSIVPVYEVGRDPDSGHAFYSMRFIRGQTLAAACSAYHARARAPSGQDDPLGFRTLLDAFVSVCRAVAYAHARGVIHRDLKGQNIVLGDYGEAIVLDWGLAKVIDEPDDGLAPVAADAPEASLHATLDGQVAGTPAYMPPEQARGEIASIDRRSDVYSLGAILYEILAGQPPYEGSSSFHILNRVKLGKLRPPREINPAAPPALEAICLKAMSRHPEDRYEGASDLADEVRRYLADEPVGAYPEPFAARAARWARKHRTAVIAAAVVMGMAVAGLAIGNVLIGRERDRVRIQREVARRAVDDMYTDVAEQWLEDRSDPLQQRFLDRALGAFEVQSGDARDVPDAPKSAPAPDPEPQDPVQKVFLERSLAYYEDFARQRGEGARSAFQVAQARLRQANLLRKLGRINDAEAAYERSIRELEGLAKGAPKDEAIIRALAIARGRLGSMLVTLGKFDEADPLLQQGEGAFAALVASGATVERDRLEWGRLLRERAERKKLSDDTREAEGLYREAIAALEPIARGPKAGPESRHELAQAQDALGVMLLLALDRRNEAAKLLDSALSLEEDLVRAEPTVPHLRAGLAKTANTLGLIRRAEGRTDEAIRALDGSLANYRRLADDFPARLEYRRALARAHLNRGNLDLDQGRVADAGANYERSAAILAALVKEAPEVTKHHRDLAYSLNNQGAAREKQDAIDDAASLYERAAEIDRGLADRFPSVLEYRQSQAIDERNLARALSRRAKGDDADRAVALASRALETFQELATARPEVVSFRRGVAESQFQLGTIHSMTGQNKKAEPLLRAAVESYRALAEKAEPTLSDRRGRIEAMSNLAELKPADAEALDRQALALADDLCKSPRAGNADRFTRAAVCNNLGEILAKKGQGAEAESLLARASTLFGEEGLGGNESQRLHYLAYVATRRAEVAAETGRDDAAVAFYREAVESDRRAVALSPLYRGFLVQDYRSLGDALAARGDHRATADLAAEMVKMLPDSNNSRIGASSLLARCMGLARQDATMPEPDRAALARLYAARGLSQIRVLLDSGYKTPDKLKADPHIRDLLKEAEARDLLPDLVATEG